MVNRRQFLKNCVSLAAITHRMPALVLDKYYQMAVEKIWRPKSSPFSNIASLSKNGCEYGHWLHPATVRNLGNLNYKTI